MYILNNVYLEGSFSSEYAWKGLGYLFTIRHVYWTLYVGLQSSWDSLWALPAWSLSGHILTPALSPFRGTHVEAVLLRRTLFIVLMTAAHISPNVFSLQLSLTNVYWTSYYNTRQCTHTYFLFFFLNCFWWNRSPYCLYFPLLPLRGQPTSKSPPRWQPISG